MCLGLRACKLLCLCLSASVKCPSMELRLLEKNWSIKKLKFKSCNDDDVAIGGGFVHFKGVCHEIFDLQFFS